MVSKKKRRQSRDKNGGREHEKENDGGGGGVAAYEQSREQRIQENLQRMQKLGILELSRNLKPPPKPKAGRPQKKPLPPPPGSPRRSSRLKTLPAVSYVEKRAPAGEKLVKVVKIEIKEGRKPEIYTEEHERALGDHKETWALMVDGYDDEGNRIYDEYVGKSCHQCRQKTIGLRTKCSKCKAIQGQFCGDCLFTRYGENVLEANANRDWVCPVCRDICNCSRCRRIKGWEPTGNVYRKALHLGFKSVAHYLIHTRGPRGNQANIADESSGSEEDPILPTDKEAEASSLVSQLDGDNTDKMDEDSKSQVLVEKDIKHHDHDHDQKSKEDDSNIDHDFSESVNEDDDSDYEDDSSEED